MSNIINNQIINSLVKQWNELSESGRDSIDCYSIIKDEIRNSHDGEIWEFVDSNPGETFDGVLNNLVESIEELAA